MFEERGTVVDRTAACCSLCRRSVLMGEPLIPCHDPRADRERRVCELCRTRAVERGWTTTGEPALPVRNARLRVRPLRTVPPIDATADDDSDEHSDGDTEPVTLRPQIALLERARGDADEERAASAPPAPALLERVRRQERELADLRAQLDPARRAAERQQYERQIAQLAELREALRSSEEHLARLQRARHAETSPMRMSGFALDAFNQSADFVRMSRIARTLGPPIANIRDEGPGIPRRLRLTLSWDIAWYEFMVKVDLGTGRASVHETGTGGDPSSLALELRRGNAAWSSSGLKLS